MFMQCVSDGGGGILRASEPDEQNAASENQEAAEKSSHQVSRDFNREGGAVRRRSDEPEEFLLDDASLDGYRYILTNRRKPRRVAAAGHRLGQFASRK